MRVPLRRVFARPLLWWGVAVVFLVRDVVGNLLTSDRPDARSVVQAGARWLHDPAAIYAETARHLAQTGMVPVTGLLRPPAAAMLGAPFSLLPGSWQVPAWTVADAIAAAIGLFLLYRWAARSPIERAVFWAVALYCPPLYAEVNAGQIGGWVILTACAAMVVYERRPAWSGALAAAGASVKLYPALMVLGASKRWRPFVIGAVAAGVVITVIACIPLGASGSWHYVMDVLIPSLRAPNPDCAQTSIATLFGRSIGGDPYPIINPDGSVTVLRSPIHLASLASALGMLTVVGAVIAVVLAARASAWNPVYGMAMGLALGGLIPGELNPYQYLPLLPLVLLVLVKAIRERRTTRIPWLAVGLLLWLRQPCLLPFPNLWTIGAIVLFATCALAAPDFKEERAGR